MDAPQVRNGTCPCMNGPPPSELFTHNVLGAGNK